MIRIIIENVSWEKVCEAISRKRIFLNNIEQTILKDGMAITIEPRPRSITEKEIPMVSFHTIGLFYNKDSKELLTNFDDIFKLCSMDYLL